MYIEPIRTLHRVLIQHRNHVWQTILLEADVSDVSLGKKLLREIGNGALRVLLNGGGPDALEVRVAHFPNSFSHDPRL